MHRSEFNKPEALGPPFNPISLATITETLEESSESTRVDTESAESAENVSLESPVELISPDFHPNIITEIDISGVQDAKDNIFTSGALPEWLRNFTNLQVLKAPRCGLLIVDPWLVEIATLNEIHLEHNLISTWPHFLRKLPELQYICLDGNPCLEKAFCKSPSLRSLFFNWGPSKDSYKTVPRYIRGPEWPVATNARMSMTLNIGNLGTYFGGIYTLSSPPDNSNEGLLTPLEPCPLQTRLSSPPSPTPSLSKDSETAEKCPQSPQDPRDLHKMRQSDIILDIFDDIEELLNRGGNVSPPEKRYVPITGTVDIGIKSYSFAAGTTKRNIDAYGILWDLMKEEEQYCADLRRAVNQFFSSRIHSSTVASCLGIIFEWFPLICNSHHKQIYPALRSLVSASGNKSKPMVLQEVDKLCRVLRDAQSSYEWYARKLNVSESYLGLPSSYATLYRNYELQEYVRKQLLKIGGMNAYLSIQFSNGPSANTIDYISRRRSHDIFKSKKEQGPVSEWATKQLNKSCSRIERHPKEYIFLPLFHIVRYERVFTMLSYMDSRFDVLKSTCRAIRRHVAYRRRTASIAARSKLLMSKFRVASETFEHYRWDAVLSVASRSYLEKGLLDPKTVDVFDTVIGEPASLVTEVFNENNQRLLRLICCGPLVQLWDEVFEQLIGTVERCGVSVKALPNNDTVQIIFAEVREVCLVSVREFSAPYVSLKSDTQEFVEAFMYDKYTF